MIFNKFCFDNYLQIFLFIPLEIGYTFALIEVTFCAYKTSKEIDC